MNYELWDEGNRLGEYPSRKRALEAAKTLIEANPEMAKSLMLGHVTANGYTARVVIDETRHWTPEEQP